MFGQSAPWSKEFPRYIPPEQARGRNVCTNGSPPASRVRKPRQIASDANHLYLVVDSAPVEEEQPKGRLRKKDFKRLRRFDNHRMQIATVARFVITTVLMFGWLVPLYLISHAVAVGAIAQKCSALIQSAVGHSALKIWLGAVHAA
jgi:hypothetical protein